jgi:MFS family permease
VIGRVDMLLLSHSDREILAIIALGLLGGLPAGPMLSLPTRPETRAIGMGVFYTLYYATMMLGPIIGGACAKWTAAPAPRSTSAPSCWWRVRCYCCCSIGRPLAS